VHISSSVQRLYPADSPIDDDPQDQFQGKLNPPFHCKDLHSQNPSINQSGQFMYTMWKKKLHRKFSNVQVFSDVYKLLF
jgi:hypothetical protein